MTNAETVKLIGLMVVAYPNYDKFKDEKHVHGTVALWGQMFAEDDFNLVQLALEKHIATSKWPPSIAEIRDLLADITLPGLLPPDEAWMAVQKLLSLHDSLFGPTSNYLPGPVAQAVDTVGYSELKELNRAAAQGRSSKVGLDRVAFYDAYSAIRQRTKERAALPGDLISRIEKAKRHYLDGSGATLQRLEENYQEEQARYSQNSCEMLALCEGQNYLTEGDGGDEVAETA